MGQALEPWAIYLILPLFTLTLYHLPLGLVRFIFEDRLAAGQAVTGFSLRATPVKGRNIPLPSYRISLCLTPILAGQRGCGQASALNCRCNLLLRAFPNTGAKSGGQFETDQACFHSGDHCWTLRESNAVAVLRNELQVAQVTRIRRRITAIGRAVQNLSRSTAISSSYSSLQIGLYVNNVVLTASPFQPSHAQAA